MNIFYLSRDPTLAAQVQCDRHVVKMILETAQLLSTAHVELDGKQVAYKSTHKNHPSAVWVRSSANAYIWAWHHLAALGREYERRYKKVHKTIREHLEALCGLPEALESDVTLFVDPPQCMPDECKRPDAVQGYQIYYNYKADDWASRGIPMKWYGKGVD